MSELGHEPTFAACQRSVWNATVNRHSGRNVGNAPVSDSTGPPNRVSRSDPFCGANGLHVRIGMLYQRDCFLGRIGSDESVAV